MHLRLRDFVRSREEGGEQFIQENFPVPDPITSGHAGPFLNFLQQELIPLIESDYQADPSDRTLLGHSWGADFTLYTLFQQPRLFQRYVAASPDPNLDDERDYAAHHDSLPVRLHLVVEDMKEQDVANLESFVNQLESRRYSGLTVTHQVIVNSTHCAVVPPAFQAGLVAVFS